MPHGFDYLWHQTMPALGMLLFLRGQFATRFLSGSSIQPKPNAIHASLPNWELIGLSGSLHCKDRDLSLALLSGPPLTSQFRSRPDDDVKRRTIVIRLMRGNSPQAQLGDVCFRRRKYFPQRLIDQVRLIHQRFFPSRTKLHDRLILDTRIR